MHRFVSPPPERSSAALCALSARAVALLLMSGFIAGSGFAPHPAGPGERPEQPRIVVLLLPGARLDDLARPELSHLSHLLPESAGAWVAAWKSFDLSSQPGEPLPIPLRRDPACPYGVTANISSLVWEARAALNTTEVLWIDPGDLERAERYAPLCLPAKAREHRMAALKGADELLAALLRDPGISDLWLLAPPVHRGAGLAPAFWWRRGSPRRAGLLRSGSTHLSGVITGADVSATLASIARTTSPGGGCPVSVSPWPEKPEVAGDRFAQSSSPLERLRRLGALAERTDRLRAVANYLIQWLLLLLIATAALSLRAERRLPRPLALAPLSLPALLLLDGARRGGDQSAAAGILLLLLIGLAAAFSLQKQRMGEGPPRINTETRSHGERHSEIPNSSVDRKSEKRATNSQERGESQVQSPNPVHPVPPCELSKSSPGLRVSVVIQSLCMTDWAALATTTAAACVVAVLAGDVFRWAILGNSIRLGVRFYGVGNEFMGWWIGAALLATGVPDPRRARPGAIIFLAGMAFLMGHPAVGGKVGGLITALAAVAVEAWPALKRRRVLIALAFGAAVAALLGVAAWDVFRSPGSQTHLGRLVLRMAAEGPHPLFRIARGKLLTNLRLTLGLWGVLLAAGVWLILEARRRAPEQQATRAVSRLLPVAAVAFLCNDSGVVAAALMLSYGVLAAGRRVDGCMNNRVN